MKNLQLERTEYENNPEHLKANMNLLFNYWKKQKILKKRLEIYPLNDLNFDEKNFSIEEIINLSQKLKIDIESLLKLNDLGTMENENISILFIIEELIEKIKIHYNANLGKYKKINLTILDIHNELPTLNYSRYSESCAYIEKSCIEVKYFYLKDNIPVREIGILCNGSFIFDKKMKDINDISELYISSK